MTNKVRVETPTGAYTVSVHRAAIMALGRNVEAVYGKSGRGRGRMVALVVREHTNGDEALPSRHGNPQKLIHEAETAMNPPRVWDFKRGAILGKLA